MVLQRSYQLKKELSSNRALQSNLWQIFEHVISVGAELLLPWMGFCDGHGTPVNRWDFVLEVS